MLEGGLQGWEERNDAAIDHLLKTVLAKSGKGEVGTSSTLVMPDSSQKLKKHLRSLIERLAKNHGNLLPK